MTLFITTTIEKAKQVMRVLIAIKQTLFSLLCATVLLRLVATQTGRAQYYKFSLNELPLIRYYLSVAECTNGEIRLVPGSDGFQYVQYCSSSEWRNMCTNFGTWQTTEAMVACRQLGYSNQGMVASREF